MNRLKIFTLTIFILTGRCDFIRAQDSLRYIPSKNYKEVALTAGYHCNFGDKVDGERPKAFHFMEVGLWKSNVYTGHHPMSFTYYLANDFGLNLDDFVIGPKIGGFLSILIVGVGAELCYYTDFDSGSLRFIPSIGLFSPYFKVTFNPHLTINNKAFQNLNEGHVNLTVRVFKIKRTG